MDLPGARSFVMALGKVGLNPGSHISEPAIGWISPTSSFRRRGENGSKIISGVKRGCIVTEGVFQGQLDLPTVLSEDSVK